MRSFRPFIGFCLLQIAFTFPTVSLSDGTSFTGLTAEHVDSFTGIQFAQAPVGELRLKPPQAFVYNGTAIQATGVPTSCPQFTTTSNVSDVVQNNLLNTVFQVQQDTNSTILPSGEDCLNLNVQRPANATADSKLPVVFWIYGGGFEFGSTQTFDATQLINASMAQGKDIVYVAANYRVGGFGFMPGKEMLADGSANIGLLDQRLALEWVADNIAAFGGDPTKVTIWGESAGSISVLDQMALYDGNNTYKGAALFRAAVMDSGSITPANSIDGTKGQAVYDQVVAKTNCTDSGDTLACLRAAPYDVFLAAANSFPGLASFSGIALSYLPRPDGTVLTESPELLIAQGKFAQVSFIIGDQEDEGTLFSLLQQNLSTTADVEDYLSTFLFTDASAEVISELVATYPDDPSAGSPFRTGIANSLYPQYKRLAAILGDATFTLTRRGLLQQVAALCPDLNTYSYLNTYGFGTPDVGTAHASDVAQIYGQPSTPVSVTIQAYYLSFFQNMDPNGAGVPSNWPTWNEENQMMNFTVDGGSNLISDSFRNESFTVLIANQASLHV